MLDWRGRLWKDFYKLVHDSGQTWVRCESSKRREWGLAWKQHREHSGFESSLLRIFGYLDHWGFTWKHWNAVGETTIHMPISALALWRTSFCPAVEQMLFTYGCI
jgi:hypothetical protein